VIMTPENWCYLDHYQAEPKNEPLAIGGMTTVEEVYSYEPLPTQLSSEEQKFIMGAQVNLWTEYISSDAQLEYMAYPRAWAFAEVAWTQKEKRNFADFKKRMSLHLKTMDHWKVNYAKHILTNN
jgi:hexosaminidase